MPRTPIVGAGFGGLSAAYELKRLLASGAMVTVVARSPDFLFIPSLIWVVTGKRAPAQISFPLAPALRGRGIAFSRATVIRFDPENDAVETDGGMLRYDYLVIATGPKYDWDLVPGLAAGHENHWAICDLDHSLAAADRVFPPRRFEQVLGGPWVHWMKLGFERYYMTKMRWGMSRLP